MPDRDETELRSLGIRTEDMTTASTGSPPAQAAAPSDVERAEPDGAEALREDIERTRDRMSSTLDQIENRIVRRRDEMWSKVTLRNVRAGIAREPWRSLLTAFAAGYVVAALRD